MKRSPTARQAQYLAFFAQYSRLTGVAPSEGDIARYFQVAPPSAHQMCVTLERAGWISRVSGVARSAQLSITGLTLPILGGHPSSPPSDRHHALAEFSIAVARQLASTQHTAFAQFASIHRLSERATAILKKSHAPRSLVGRTYITLLSIADSCLQPIPSSPSQSTNRPSTSKKAAPRERRKEARAPKPETSQIRLFPEPKE
jgi:hypothetical protein